jgi:hypothetical protein
LSRTLRRMSRLGVASLRRMQKRHKVARRRRSSFALKARKKWLSVFVESGMDVAVGEGVWRRSRRKQQGSRSTVASKLNHYYQPGHKWPASKEKSRNMRSKLGLAISLVLALALGTSSALARSTAKNQNANSSTTTAMATTKSKRSKRWRKHHKRRSMKRNSKKTGNANTRT